MSFDPAALRQDYGDALCESRLCRQAAAVFDFSFVARGRVSGPGTLAAVQSLVARRLDGLRIGEIAYALRTDADGFVLSDVTVWRTHETAYELMSGRRADIADLLALQGEHTAEDLSDATSIFAIQGPLSLAVLNTVGCDAVVSRLAYFRFADACIAGVLCRVGRLGYTGEAGFEIIAHRRDAEALWRVLSSACQPAGFASANILRIEAGFILLCNELKLRVRPAELSLASFAALPAHSEAGDCRLVTFRSDRTDTPFVWQPQQTLQRPAAGQLTVTSACTSPMVEGTLGLGFARVADLDGPRRPLRLHTAEFGAVQLLAHPFFDTGKKRPRQPWGEPPR